MAATAEKVDKARQAEKAIREAKTVEQLREVWHHPEYGFLVLGHKILARMALLGQTAEKATGANG